MDDCIFCKMVAGEIPVVKVYEDEAVLAFLDIGPISDGHTLVIPKVHCGKVHECDPQVLADVWSRLGRIAGAIAGAMKADGYNVLCNNGRAAGQIVDHLHFHTHRKTNINRTRHQAQVPIRSDFCESSLRFPRCGLRDTCGRATA